MPKTITIRPKALEGDTVNVLNYRKTPSQWEPGVVYGFGAVEARIYQDGVATMAYRVLLDRRSDLGNMIFLYVGDKRIKKTGEVDADAARL